MHFVLPYKDAILSANNLTALPNVGSNVLQAFNDVFFKRRYQLAYPHLVGFNIK